MENKRPVRLSWIAVLAVVVILCLGAYFLATRIVDARLPQLDKAISIPATSNHVIKALGDGLLQYDGATLHAFDGRGRQIWSHPAGSLAQVDVSAGGVALWSGTTLSLLDARNGALLYSGNIGKNDNGNIISARLGRTYAAVQVEVEPSAGKTLSEAQREHNSFLVLLDSNGRQQMDRILMANQTVLDFGFFSSDQLFWAMALNTEGTEPVCEISSYKPGRMMLGRFHDPEQVLYAATFQSNKIRVVGLTHIKDFDYQGKEIPQNRILVYGWYMVDRDDRQDNPMMAFVPTDQADGIKGITDVRIIRDGYDQTIHLPSAAEQVFVRDDMVYALARDRVMVCRSADSEAEVYQTPVKIDRVVGLTDNHSAIVISGSQVYMIMLP